MGGDEQYNENLGVWTPLFHVPRTHIEKNLEHPLQDLSSLPQPGDVAEMPPQTHRH